MPLDQDDALLLRFVREPNDDLWVLEGQDPCEVAGASECLHRLEEALQRLAVVDIGGVASRSRERLRERRSTKAVAPAPWRKCPG